MRNEISTTLFYPMNVYKASVCTVWASFSFNYVTRIRFVVMEEMLRYPRCSVGGKVFVVMSLGATE